MDSGTFDYNGVNSSKFGVLVQKRPDRVTSTHNFYSADPSAADNPSLRDKKTYTKTSIKLMCWFKSPDKIEEYNQKLTDIVDWLDLGRDDVSFTPWYDSSHTYKCSLSGGLTFVNFDDRHRAITFDLTLQLDAWKYQNSGLKATSYGTSFTVTNPTKNTALPMSLVLTGAGDVTITINQRVLTVKGVKDKVTIDSINKRHSGGTMVGLDYPYLDPGLNTIKVTAATAVSLAPYWREKVV